MSDEKLDGNSNEKLNGTLNVKYNEKHNNVVYIIKHNYIA